ncbi:Ku protein [Kitasatospora sp. NPDC057223]|uniref:non-homologous end joining protein Ku n=1 Tax=Kitasatospora sp. NPDC057223 TaxID=3346055 RepID=UPI0036441A9A
MARPIWSGILTFGLVSVPVSLYAATENHTVSFRQIQRGTSDRVRNKRVNERTGEEVPFGEIVKGYEVAEGEYVIVEPEELEQLSPGRSKTIEISGFVDLDQVDPTFFDTTYYLGPKDKGYAKVYSLLQQALEKANRAGIALFAMRGKEYLTAVRADRGILTAHTMHFADEVRDPRTEIPTLPAADAATVSERELAMAGQLIDMLAVDWNPDQYKDTFEEKVHELIAAKQAGQTVTAPEAAPKPSNVLDLMEVLSRSLESAKPSGTAASGTATAEDETAGEQARPNARTGAEGWRTAGEQRTTTAGRSAQRRPKDADGKKTTATTARARTATSATGKQTGAAAARREDLSALTKTELYQRATELDLPHRSTMTRDELQHALEKAARGRHLRSAS